MPREAKRLEGIEVKEHNGPDNLTILNPDVTQNWLLVKINPCLRTMVNSVIDV